MKEKGDEYGLVRREGLAFIIPGRGIAAMNMTHVETPLDPLEASARILDSRDQADRAVAFLRHEFAGLLREMPGARLWLSRHPPNPLDRRTPTTDRG